MAGAIATIPKFQFSNAAGIPMVLGTLETYLAGSTTPTPTYQDKSMGTANTNPIELDGRGECLLWLNPLLTYKFVLKNAAGATQWTVDNIAGAEQAGLKEALAGSTGSSMVGFIQAGTGATATTLQAMLREWFVTPEQFGANPGVSDDTIPFQRAFATGRPVYVSAALYIAALSVRRNNVVLFGPGSAQVTIRQPAGGLSPGGVFEVNDTSAGNSAPPLSGLVVHGVTLDGNRSNTTAPTSDLVGHGLIWTAMSDFHVSDVVAINCHNAGIIPAINSNNGHIQGRVENCGNATYSGPGFDVNSSKYINADIVSIDCYQGARVLDNCWGINGRFTVYNSTKQGFIYNNQSANASYNNNFDISVNTCGDHGMSIGENCTDSNIRVEIDGSLGYGMIITDLGATSASRNKIELVTRGGQFQGLLCYGHDNDITHKSFNDCLSGSPGDNYASEIYGDRNTFKGSIIGSGTPRPRGFIIRTGAEDNILSALTTNNIVGVAFTDQGTRSRITRPDYYTSVASGSPFDPGVWATVVNVTGGGTVGDMTVVNGYGRRMTLVFASSTTVSDSGTMKCNGPFNAVAGDTWSGVCDGTYWYETSRSSNSQIRFSGSFDGTNTVDVVEGLATAVS